MHAMPILTIEAAENLLVVLEDFLEDSEASFALIIERGGAILGQHGEIPPSIDPTIVAALAAGSFAATRELALRVGETEFSALHQQGKECQIFMSAVNEDAVLVTVFGSKSTLGLVRFYSVRAIKRIAAILEHARQQSQPSIDLGDDVLDDLHEVFNEHPSRHA
jgi:predicted regulator of Ras-like GTPase activity (Roadblock/LC7/MglB family)